MTTATAEHLPATLTAKTLEKFAVTTAAIAKIAADTLAISVRDHGIKEVERHHKDLKKLNADIEARRVELKAPAWAECQAIDSVAKQLKESLAPSLEHLAEERKIHDDAVEEKKRQAREAERQKIQSRIDRLTAAKLPVDLMAVQTLTDAAFESMVTDGLQAIAEAEVAAAEAKAAEEAQAAEAARIAAEEMARQQEELRIRAEELAAERRKMQEAAAAEAKRQAEAKAEADTIRAAEEAVRQAAIAEERRKLDEERQMVAAEQARIKAEEAKRQAEISAAAKIERDRIKAIEEAENLRQWQESQAREKEAKEAAAAALLPELEKAEAFANFLDVQAAVWLKKNGDPAWTKKAMGLLDMAFEGLSDYIRKHQ